MSSFNEEVKPWTKERELGLKFFETSESPRHSEQQWHHDLRIDTRKLFELRVGAVNKHKKASVFVSLFPCSLKTATLERLHEAGVFVTGLLWHQISLSKATLWRALKAHILLWLRP